MTERGPQVRDVWKCRIDAGEEKIRYCVVMDLDNEGRVSLVYGQGRPDPFWTDDDPLTHHIEVSPGTSDGRRFRVIKPTYFRATNQRTVTVDRLTERMGCCSQEMFLNLNVMLDRYYLALDRRVGHVATEQADNPAE